MVLARAKKKNGIGPGYPDSGHSCLRIGWTPGPAESQKVTESREVGKLKKDVIGRKDGSRPDTSSPPLEVSQSGPKSGVKDSYPLSREGAESRNITTFVTFWNKCAGSLLSGSGF